MSMQLHDWDIELDLEDEGLPLSTYDLISDRLGYLEARPGIRDGRPMLDLRVRAVNENAARSYARHRIALELHL